MVEPQVFGLKGDTPSLRKTDADLSLMVLSISEINPFALRNASSATINGAFATALCEDQSIKDSLIFANTFAGISTTRVGTAKSMPTREEIDKLL